MYPARDGSLVESHPCVTGSGKYREFSLVDRCAGTEERHRLTVVPAAYGVALFASRSIAIKFGLARGGEILKGNKGPKSQSVK